MDEEYRDDLRRIQSGDDPRAVRVSSFVARPSTYGWLRRPEFDRPGHEAWETPDGGIVAVPLAEASRRRT